MYDYRSLPVVGFAIAHLACPAQMPRLAVTFCLDTKSNQKNQVIPIAATTQARLPAAWAYKPLRFFSFFIGGNVGQYQNRQTGSFGRKALKHVGRCGRRGIASFCRGNGPCDLGQNYAARGFSGFAAQRLVRQGSIPGDLIFWLLFHQGKSDKASAAIAGQAKRARI